MRKRLIWAASVVAAAIGGLLAAAGASAQAPASPVAAPAATANAPAAEPAPAPAEPSGLTKGEIKAQRDFKMLDFNGDGKLSRKEVQLFPRLAAAFDEADTDRDGFVSYEEVREFAVKYRAERERVRAALGGQSPAGSGPARGAAPALDAPQSPPSSPFASPAK